MAYYGNLALRPERAPQQQEPQQQRPANRGKTTKKAHIPVAEKLLYLFTIAVVVVIAGLIIFRYAEIYQMTGEIQQTRKALDQQVEKGKELQKEIEKKGDPERIRSKAVTELGMVEVGSDDGITVTQENGQDAVAMKP